MSSTIRLHALAQHSRFANCTNVRDMHSTWASAHWTLVGPAVAQRSHPVDADRYIGGTDNDGIEGTDPQRHGRCHALRDTQRRDTLRMLAAAIKQVEVDEQTTLDDAGVLAVLTKQAKQRRESIAEYEQAGRTDLVESEQDELVIIESYLPQMMSREEIAALAAPIVAELGASGPKDMGKVMGRLMPQLKGKADGRDVNEVVRALLQG